MSILANEKMIKLTLKIQGIVPLSFLRIKDKILLHNHKEFNS